MEIQIYRIYIYNNYKYKRMHSANGNLDSIIVTECIKLSVNEPPHEKTNKMPVHPAKTHISLGIRLVWSESWLSAWSKLGSLAIHWAHGEDPDPTGWMPRLIWVFAGRTAILLVLSCRGSNVWMHLANENVDSHLQQNASEPRHDKTNKMAVRPAKNQISLGIRPVWSVFAVRMKKAWVLSYPLSGWPGWSESSLGAHTFCWFYHVAAHFTLSYIPDKKKKESYTVKQLSIFLIDCKCYTSFVYIILKANSIDCHISHLLFLEVKMSSRESSSNQMGLNLLSHRKKYLSYAHYQHRISNENWL